MKKIFQLFAFFTLSTFLLLGCGQAKKESDIPLTDTQENIETVNGNNIAIDTDTEDPRHVEKMVFVENQLYVNTGVVVNYMDTPTFTDEIMEFVSEKETPQINNSANFETKGYKRINDNFIAVLYNDNWLHFARPDSPLFDNYTVVYSMMTTSNVMGDVSVPPYIPYLCLDEDTNKFCFTYDVLSDYVAYGNYDIIDEKIVCKTSDNEFIYTFDIQDEDIISFNKGESSFINFISDDCSVDLKNGTTFFSNRDYK